jgi:hypothetical protein
MSDTDVVQEPEVQVDAPPKIVVTDEEVRQVAELMDIDEELIWDSKSHEDQVACINALAEAKHALIGYKACVYAGANPVEPAKPDTDDVDPTVSATAPTVLDVPPVEPEATFAAPPPSPPPVQVTA